MGDGTRVRQEYCKPCKAFLTAGVGSHLGTSDGKLSDLLSWSCTVVQWTWLPFPSFSCYCVTLPLFSLQLFVDVVDKHLEVSTSIPLFELPAMLQPRTGSFLTERETAFLKTPVSYWYEWRAQGRDTCLHIGEESRQVFCIFFSKLSQQYQLTSSGCKSLKGSKSTSLMASTLLWRAGCGGRDQ